MRIATYNVWNDERGGTVRQEQLVRAVAAVDADVMALQEVRPAQFRDGLAGLFPHAAFRAYAGRMRDWPS